MNKKHWNTVTVQDSDVDEETVFDLIDHSYELVYNSLTKKQKTILLSQPEAKLAECKT